VEPVRIAVPVRALIVLIGPSGAGKSSFAAAHFRPTEVVSSDEFRAMVGDDEADQAATEAAFELLHLVADRRLAAGRLTVVDATNVQAEGRRALVDLARRHQVMAVAVAFDLPERDLRERSELRPGRRLPAPAIRRQRADLVRSLRTLPAEGFGRAFVLRSPEEVATAGVERQDSWPDREAERGPFDVVGAVGGRPAALVYLLGRLGYHVDTGSETGFHPAGRRAVFAGGDGTSALVRGMVARGSAVHVTERTAFDGGKLVVVPVGVNAAASEETVVIVGGRLVPESREPLGDRASVEDRLSAVRYPELEEVNLPAGRPAGTGTEPSAEPSAG
jgi:protein phosphatase